MASPAHDTPVSLSPETESCLSATAASCNHQHPRRSLLTALNEVAHNPSAMLSDGTTSSFTSERGAPCDKSLMSSCGAEDDASMKLREEVDVLRRECSLQRNETQLLRLENAHQNTQLIEKENKVQENDRRLQELQHHYERLVQEQLTKGLQRVQDQLSVSERQAHEQLLEIARLQGELGKVYRLEAELQERITMETELTALLQEKVEECVRLQHDSGDLTAELIRTQAALSAAMHQKDLLSSDLEQLRRVLEYQGLWDGVRTLLYDLQCPQDIARQGRAISGGPDDGRSCPRLREEKSLLQAQVKDLRAQLDARLSTAQEEQQARELEALRATVLDLREELDRAATSQHALETQLVQHRETAEAAHAQRGAAEADLRRECAVLRGRIEEQQQQEQQLRQWFEHEIAVLSKTILAEKQAFEQEKEREVKRLCDENDRLRAVTQPRDGGGLAELETWTSMQRMIGDLQRMVTLQQHHDGNSPTQRDAPAAAADPPAQSDASARCAAPDALPGASRGSPRFNDPVRRGPNRPSPTTAPLSARCRLSSLNTRRDQPGTASPPCGREPSPTGRHSSPNRFVVNAPPRRPAATRSSSVSYRGSPTALKTRPVEPQRGEAEPQGMLFCHAPRTTPVPPPTARPPAPPPRIGDRSMAAVLKRPTPPVAPHPTPPKVSLDRKRATSAPHVAKNAAVGAPAAHLRAPKAPCSSFRQPL